MKNKIYQMVGSIFALALSMIVFIKGYKAILKAVYPIKYEDIVNEMSKEYNIEPELIYAVIKTESGFDNGAKSSAGALGLMQITPKTFEWLKKNKKRTLNEPEEILNPKVNIGYGVLFLSILREKYDSEILVLCAYNAGMSAVDRWIREKKVSKNEKDFQVIPYKETKYYVKKVKGCKRMYKMLYF